MRILTHTVTAAEDGQTAKQLLRGLWHISGSLLSRLPSHSFSSRSSTKKYRPQMT